MSFHSAFSARRIGGWVSVVLTAVALAACGGGSETIQDNSGVVPPKSPLGNNPGVSLKPSANPGSTPVVSAAAREMLALVNQVRSRGRNCGNKWYPVAPPVTWSAELAQAATAHSQDMADRRYFSHRAPAPAPYGAAFGQRADYFKYPLFPRSENIAAGDTTAREAIDSWVKSAGHCANLMDPSATQVGMGHDRASRYWTQMFGMPL